MKRFVESSNNILIPEVITIIAAILTTIVVQVLFDLTSISGFIEGLSSLLMIILIVFSIGTIKHLYLKTTDVLNKSRLSAKIFQARQAQGGGRLLYDPMIDFISSASESIRIVHRFMPSPIMEITHARERYYQALEDLLKRKHQEGKKFYYERILQVSDIRQGALGPDQTDTLLFEHCKHVIELQKCRTSLKILLRQVPNVLGSMGFIIVDDCKIMLLIPTISRGKNNKLSALHLGTGIALIDPAGMLVKEMLSLFDDLHLESKPFSAADTTSQYEKDNFTSE